MFFGANCLLKGLASNCVHWLVRVKLKAGNLNFQLALAFSVIYERQLFIGSEKSLLFILK